jgi:hypothetical protein
MLRKLAALTAVALAGCGSTSVRTVTNPAPPATVSAPATVSQAPPNPCPNITLTAHTSCPFAKNVITAYLAAPSTSIQAYSPITGRTYTMQCAEASGTVSCVGSNDNGVAFQGPPPASNSTSAAPAPATPAPAAAPTIETAGSPDHATDAQFCSAHSCIANFPNGNGTIVQCSDGEWSHSGGLSGACSSHGGEG